MNPNLRKAVDLPPLFREKIGIKVDCNVARGDDELSLVPRVAKKEPKLLVENDGRNPARGGKRKRCEELSFRRVCGHPAGFAARIDDEHRLAPHKTIAHFVCREDRRASRADATLVGVGEDSELYLARIEPSFDTDRNTLPIWAAWPLLDATTTQVRKNLMPGSRQTTGMSG